MVAANLTLAAEQGVTWNPVLAFTNSDGSPWDFTGFTGSFVVATGYGATPLLTLTGGQGLTFGGVLGTLAIVVTAAQTASLPLGQLVYELNLVDSLGLVYRPIDGLFIVEQQI